ncbi:MAG: cobaltochelatase subunit CobN, partial [Pseudomonadota bacterium]
QISVRAAALMPGFREGPKVAVDTYIEQTLSASKGILIRLIGGVPYWTYGLQQVLQLCKEKDIALAVLPADGRPDPRLDDYSTLPVSTLRQLASLCDQGGAIAAQAALAQMAIATGLYAKPVPGFKGVPAYGAWTPEGGISPDLPASAGEGAQRILIVFYRSYLVAADLAPIKALFEAFRPLGYEVNALFAASLKAPDAAKWIREQVATLAPSAIVNATAFSGKGDDGTSPLDKGGVPVFQVALATSTRKAWSESDRGLSPADLAMHVVLPEVDGRILAGLASHKEPGTQDPALEFSRFAHRPATDRVTAIAARVHGWLSLAIKPVADRRVALVLSTYPGKNWNFGHAVGLDALASAQAILEDLSGAGYAVPPMLCSLETALNKTEVSWALERYKSALADLPMSLQTDLQTAWGDPENDPDVESGEFRFRAIVRGNSIVALQPERGSPENRVDDYHDLSRTPRHAYVAFYLWLQHQCDALIHIGAHGTLEWLPGKSVALSAECWPEVLIGSLPVLYPFVVNDPGEAAQAKRRLGALTIGHIPPPMKQGGTPERLVRLESLLDEFSNADGLDPKRRERLQDDIRFEAQSLGVEDQLGLDGAGCAAEAITRIDRFVCDVKDSLFGEGLHIWGRPPKAKAGFDTAGSIEAERQSLLDALDGKWIAPGPAGSPYRGRTDVLPTGRNIYSVDPRAVPTRSAYAQGTKLGEELVRHHLQTEGDWPKRLIVDLWGSATMRTAGEEFAMALYLLGVKPIWDQGTERVSGITVIPIAELDRPRIDVTLRISGLFRDVFPTLSALYSQAIRVLSRRDEAADWNPFAGRDDVLRVYGPAPGSFGLAMGAAAEDFSQAGLHAAGEAWLSASSWAHDGDHVQRDRAGLERRVRQADSFVHLQDLPETDLLLAADYAAHEAGFAAAQKVTGGQAALYHLDSTIPERPRARHLSEEIARVVHARAANPAWVAGMRDHGFRGAAEIAATLDHMAAFAHLAGAVSPQLFDMFHDATLGDPETEAFLESANPEAHAAMQARFAELLEAGLWRTRRNSIRASLEAAQ